MIELRVSGAYVGPPYNHIPLPLVGDTGITEVVFCPWCRDLFIQFDIAGLGSGDSVTVVVEGSLDNDSWDYLRRTIDTADVQTLISSNGCTIMPFRGAVTPYVRVRLIGTTGVLTEATIAIRAYMQVIS